MLLEASFKSNTESKRARSSWDVLDNGYFASSDGPKILVSNCKTAVLSAQKENVNDFINMGNPWFQTNESYHSPDIFVKYRNDGISKWGESWEVQEINPTKEFELVIEKSKYILALESGWDEDEGKVFNQVLFDTSCKNILDYIDAIYNDKKIVIKAPQINPVPDGSLDFEWQLDNARFLINYREENGDIIGFYYGDLKKNLIPIKGNVPANRVFEHLMKWMQFLK